MKAVGKNIIIQKAKEGVTKTSGGLLLGEKQKEDIRYTQAKIISVGEEVVGLKEGDEIYFDRHAGHKIPELTNETYHVIKAVDVVVVL
jgi:co-chaperonin GroES (HSP10)